MPNQSCYNYPSTFSPSIVIVALISERKTPCNDLISSPFINHSFYFRQLLAQINTKAAEQNRRETPLRYPTEMNLLVLFDFLENHKCHLDAHPGSGPIARSGEHLIDGLLEPR